MAAVAAPNPMAAVAAPRPHPRPALPPPPPAPRGLGSPTMASLRRMNMYHSAHILAYLGDIPSLTSAARVCKAFHEASRVERVWAAAFAPLGYAARGCGPREVCLASATFRTQIAAGASRTASSAGIGSQVGSFELEVDGDGPLGAALGVDEAGDARIVRRRVRRGGRARWTRFRGRMRMNSGGACVAMSGLAEKEYGDLPSAVVLLALHEEGLNGEGMLGNNPSMVGVHCITPCEYRGLRLGPVLLGSFGFTPHAVCQCRAMGVWSARLPGAPYFGDDDVSYATALQFEGVALAAAADAVSELRGTSWGKASETSVFGAKVSLRDIEATALPKELGYVAAATLSLAVEKSAATATLAVASARGDGRLEWSTATLAGTWHDRGGAWRLSLRGPVRDDRPNADVAWAESPATPFGASARRLRKLSCWPDALAVDGVASLQLDGEFEAGILVAQLLVDTGPPACVKTCCCCAFELAADDE